MELMRIDSSLVHFCARKTAEIATDYDKYCIHAGEGDGFPRSADDLEVLVAGIYGKPISLRLLRIDASRAKFRSFYIPYPDRCDIYFAKNIVPDHMKYYKSKELLQIHLWQESLRTHDVVELVQNMILRATPESIELDLGHAATSDTLGDIAAMEFLFPFARRLEYGDHPENDGLVEIGERFGIPPFIVQRCFNTMESLTEFFGPGEEGGNSHAA
jgi:hypothetical protein